MCDCVCSKNHISTTGDNIFLEEILELNSNMEEIFATEAAITEMINSLTIAAISGIHILYV